MSSCSGSIRRRESCIAVGIGTLPIPDPRTWPEEIRTWYRNVTGGAGPLDVFLFDHDRVAALYLQDAVTAAAILDIDPSEWHTERGYPAFVFDAARIGEIQRCLDICGYNVNVLEPKGERRQPGSRKRARVLSISIGHQKMQGEETR